MSRLRRLLPPALALVAFFLCLWTIPAAWCRRGASAWIQGDIATQTSLARTVARQLDDGLTKEDYKTGSELFNGEWLFGTHLMAGIGFCQMVKAHPATAAEWKPAIEQCIRELLSDKVREFDRASWRADALATLDANEGHAAYLGYLNFLLSLYRGIAPENEFAALNDSITASLIRRIEASPSGLIATYPGEWYPVDNTPVIASIALHGQATGRDYSPLLQRQEARFQKRWIVNGLLIQATNGQGDPTDHERGSGSTLGVFFLHHAYPALSGEIYAGIKRRLETDVFGFGAIREYPHGTSGRRDIDSGPVIFGLGFSATGFAISNARAYGDDRLFAKLYSSAVLAGAPSRPEGRLDFLTGGPLGNAILFAMFTTATVP